MTFAAAILASTGLTFGVTSSALAAPIRARVPRLACAQCVGFWCGLAWAIAARWTALDALGLAFGTSLAAHVTARAVAALDASALAAVRGAVTTAATARPRPTRADLTRAASDATPWADCNCNGEPRQPAPRA